MKWWRLKLLMTEHAVHGIAGVGLSPGGEMRSGVAMSGVIAVFAALILEFIFRARSGVMSALTAFGGTFEEEGRHN